MRVLVSAWHRWEVKVWSIPVHRSLYLRRLDETPRAEENKNRPATTRTFRRSALLTQLFSAHAQNTLGNPRPTGQRWARLFVSGQSKNNQSMYQSHGKEYTHIHTQTHITIIKLKVIYREPSRTAVLSSSCCQFRVRFCLFLFSVHNSNDSYDRCYGSHDLNTADAYSNDS